MGANLKSVESAIAASVTASAARLFRADGIISAMKSAYIAIPMLARSAGGSAEVPSQPHTVRTFHVRYIGS